MYSIYLATRFLFFVLYYICHYYNYIAVFIHFLMTFLDFSSLFFLPIFCSINFLSDCVLCLKKITSTSAIVSLNFILQPSVIYYTFIKFGLKNRSFKATFGIILVQRFFTFLQKILAEDWPSPNDFVFATFYFTNLSHFSQVHVHIYILSLFSYFKNVKS